MSDATLPPVLFTSIPKCGKNIINSFLFGLGYEYVTLEKHHGFYASHFSPFHDMAAKDHYLAPRDKVSASALQDHREIFKKELQALTPGKMAHSHIYRDSPIDKIIDKLKLKIIFVYRDPRDCLLSAANYAFDQQKPAHIYEKVKNLSRHEAIGLLLEGDGTLIPFAEWFDGFFPWLHDPHVIALKFEDIVGAKGGGSDAVQKAAFLDLVTRLDIPVTPEQFSAALAKAFNPSAGTFRKGQIGSWNNEFTSELKGRFNATAGFLLEKWGYPAGDTSARHGEMSGEAVEFIIDELIDIRNTKDKLKAQLAEKTRENEVLSAQLADITSRHNEMSARVTKLTRHFGEKNQECEKLNTRITRITRHFDMRTKERDAAINELEKTKQTLAYLQGGIPELLLKMKKRVAK